MSENEIKPAAVVGKRPEWLENVSHRVGSLRYGVVQIILRLQTAEAG
jgi:hypothetical protein